MSFPKIYTVNGPSSTSASSLPSWLTIKARPTRTSSGAKKRTKTQHTLGQLELIQDFTFPGSAIKIKTTEDGRHVMATGTYKPMIKVWDLDQLTEKFARVTESENVDFVLLSDDWTKSLHLQRDRSLQLHTQGGLHHTVRLPTYGRSLAYHSPSADAVIGCTGTEVHRFNLEEGRYMTPLNVARGWGDGREDEVEGVNVVDVNPRHGLWSFGLDGGGGVVEFWDPRSRSALTRLVLPASTLLPVPSIDRESIIAAPTQKLSVTSLRSHPTDGLSLAIGTSSGHALLYDLRSPTPFAIKDQGYGEAVKSVDWLRGGGAQEDTGRVISADTKVIKVWGKNDASTNYLSLHPPNALADLHPVPNSGLLLVATEAPQLSSYYIPEIGPAPKWAGFLDNVTEELAEDASSAGRGAYTDFKFVDKAELDTLGLSHLIGTPALKPYMHGYFLSLKLYSTARLISNPNSYDDYREKIISQRLAAKAESRIRARKDQPKVNKALAERLRRVEEVEKKKKERKGANPDADAAEEVDGQGGVLTDPRFKELFEDPEYEVDERSREYALLNPATVDRKNAIANANANGRRKTAVEEEEDESEGASSDLEEDSEDGASGDDSAGGSDGDSDDGDLQQYDPRKVKPGQAGRALPGFDPTVRATSSRRPQLTVGSSSSSAGPSSTSASSTFGQRLQSSSKGKTSAGTGAGAGAGAGVDPNMKDIMAMRRSADGGMEMSFIPTSSASRRKANTAGGESGDSGESEDGDGGRAQGQKAKKDRKVERFGAGLQKGLTEEEEPGRLDTDSRSGRTKRRHPGRSASKNAFRRK